MLELLGAWFALLTILLLFGLGRAREGGALTIAYFLGLSLIHVPGALAFLSERAGLDAVEESTAGFQLTVIGMAAFVVGVVIARLQGSGAGGRARTAEVLDIARRNRAANLAIVGGFLSYFVLLPLAGLVPSITSLISTLGGLLIIGLWLRLDIAARAGDRFRFASTLALLPLLPIGTLVTAGFLGYGVNWIISVLGYVFVQSRRRWIYAAVAPVAVILGLSLFIAYLGERNEIRDAVWTRQASFTDRFDRIAGILDHFEILNLDEPRHAYALNARLNQNALVGVGMLRHQAGVVDLLYGATVQPWALIPRAIWRSKPVIGGSGDLVSNFTGITFAASTSVGTGQVFEFYMNFGTIGVIVGFFFLGWGLRRLDLGIARAIERDDMRALLLRALPGVMLLQPGGSLVEILVAAVAALIAAWGLSKFLPRLGLGPPPSRRRARPSPGRAW